MKQARPSRFIALCLFAGTALVAFAGCTMIGDTLNGVHLNAVGPTSCVKDCNEFYKAEFEREQKLYQTNKEACLELPQPDKDACLAAELARHQAAMEALGEAKVECQNDCHRQGAGTAG